MFPHHKDQDKNARRKSVFPHRKDQDKIGGGVCVSTS